MGGIPNLDGSEGRGSVGVSFLGNDRKHYRELVTVAVHSARRCWIERVSVPPNSTSGGSRADCILKMVSPLSPGSAATGGSCAWGPGGPKALMWPLESAQASLTGTATQACPLSRENPCWNHLRNIFPKFPCRLCLPLLPNADGRKWHRGHCLCADSPLRSPAISLSAPLLPCCS